MLNSIEDLENEIQEFQKNVSDSGEIVKRLTILVDLLKRNNEEHEKLETFFHANLSKIPEEIERKSNEVLRSSLKEMDIKKNEMVESLDRMKQEFDKSKGKLNEQYELFVAQLNSTNLHQIAQKVVAAQHSIKVNFVFSIIILVSIIMLIILILAGK